MTFCQAVIIAILEPCEKELNPILDAVWTADDTVGLMVKLE